MHGSLHDDMICPSAAPHLWAPDFFLVGAPKCGTTALHSYLSSHPGIFMSPKKGPHFWSSDLDSPGAITGEAAYRDLWDGSPRDSMKGEASVEYLRSKVAVPAILRANPAARFVAVLRSPVEMAAAWHSHLLFIHAEDEPDLERAWRLQEARRTGKRVPSECARPEWLQYRDFCALGDQLERFMDQVPEDLRHIMIFDDFATDTGSAYRSVLGFLGVGDDGRREFPPVNSNRSRRSLLLARLHRRAPTALGPLYPTLRRGAAAIGISPSRLIDRLNVRRGPRRDQAAFAAELRREFRPQVEKMERLLRRDLSHWR